MLPQIHTPSPLLFAVDIITRKSWHLGISKLNFKKKKLSRKEQAGTKTTKNKLAWVRNNLKRKKSPRNVSLETAVT